MRCFLCNKVGQILSEYRVYLCRLWQRREMKVLTANRKSLKCHVKLDIGRVRPMNIEVLVIDGTLLGFWGSMRSRIFGECVSLNREMSASPRKIYSSAPPFPLTNLILVYNSTTRRRFGLPHGNVIRTRSTLTKPLINRVFHDRATSKYEI